MTNTGRAAFFVGSGAAPGAALEVLTNREGLPLSAIDVVCCEQPAGLPSPRSYPLGLSATSAAGQHDRDRLGRIAKALSPGAKLYIYEAAGAGLQGRTDTLAKELVLSGFQGFEAIPTQDASLLVLVSTPKWELGAKAALSLQPRTAVAAQQDKHTASKAAAWTVAADDADEDEELIDEAQLLTEADKVRPAPAADDCEVGKEGRKACKNCTCGRAEAEAAGVKAQLTPEMLENPQSACGSCGLGDAFRCAGCPYRGLPSFEPGKKIELPSDFLAADF